MTPLGVRANERVEITSVGPTLVAEEFEALLHDLLDRLPIELALLRRDEITADVVLRPDPTPILARVWVDFRGPEHASLYFLSGSRVLLRDVPMSADGADEVVREQLGQIVSASVDAVLRGSDVGVAREHVRRELGLDPAEPEPESEVPLPPAAEDSRAWEPQVRLALGYEFRWWSVPTHGTPLAIELLARADRFSVGARLEGVYRVRVNVDAESIAARFGLGTVRALLSAGWAASHRTELRAAIGLALEVVRVTPKDTLGTAELRPPQTSVEPTLSLSMAATVWPTTRLGLEVRVGIDIEPQQTRYVFMRGDRVEVVFDPPPVRPTIALLLSVAL